MHRRWAYILAIIGLFAVGVVYSEVRHRNSEAAIALAAVRGIVAEASAATEDLLALEYDDRALTYGEFYKRSAARREKIDEGAVRIASMPDAGPWEGAAVEYLRTLEGLLAAQEQKDRTMNTLNGSLTSASAMVSIYKSADQLSSADHALLRLSGERMNSAFDRALEAASSFSIGLKHMRTYLKKRPAALDGFRLLDISVVNQTLGAVGDVDVAALKRVDADRRQQQVIGPLTAGTHDADDDATSSATIDASNEPTQEELDRAFPPAPSNDEAEERNY
jgi:hypothetical protein